MYIYIYIHEIDIDAEGDVDIDRYLGSLEVVSKSVQVLSSGIEAVMVRTANSEIASPVFVTRSARHDPVASIRN